MRTPISAIFATCIIHCACEGAQIVATSFNLGGANISLFTDVSGSPLERGSAFVSIGSFSLEPSEINLDNLSQVARNFNQFGSPGNFASDGAFRFPGLYNFAPSDPLVEGDSFVGSVIYTVISDTVRVEDSSDLIVYEHTGQRFFADAPLFTDLASTASNDPGRLLIGRAGTANFPELLGEVATVSFPVPEPSSALLLASGLCLLLGRRVV